MVAVGGGGIALVHERHHLVAQVVVVPAGPGRVQELAAAERRPRVDEHDDRRRRTTPGEHRVGRLHERLAVRRPVVPHRDGAGVALDHIDARVAALGFVVVPRRHVDPQRPLARVPERVAPQHLGGEDVFVEAAGQRRGPRQADCLRRCTHRHSSALFQACALSIEP